MFSREGKPAGSDESCFSLFVKMMKNQESVHIYLKQMLVGYEIHNQTFDGFHKFNSQRLLFNKKFI